MRYKEGESFRTYALAASQTFKAGAPAVLTSGANTVQEGGTDPTPIVGFFLADAADYAWMDDTFGKVVPSVPIALANQEFRGTLEATYVAATHVIGFECGIVKDATGYWTLDPSDTTNVLARLTGFDSEVADGDINPPVRFVVIEADREVLA